MFPGRGALVLLATLASAAGLSAGCTDDVSDKTIQAVGDDDGGDADGAGDATTDGAEAASDSVADAGETSDSGGGVDASDGGSADSADAVAETPVSTRCGDGVRDPILEECDDGLDAGADADASDAASDSDAPAEPAIERRSCNSSCQVLDLLAVAASPDAGPSPHARVLGNGRHPLAGDSHGFAVTFTEPDETPVRVSLTTFNDVGTPSEAVVAVSTGTTALFASNPVLAAVGDGRYFAAWTDLDGDGDELGIALRILDPVSTGSTSPRHANVTTAFSQYDPDILSAFDSSGQVVVAWVDDSVASTGPDVKARIFDRGLSPIGGEIPIATTAASEADVALAPFNTTWAIAWKSATGGSETAMVKTGATVWHTEEYLAGPSTSRPALAQLDSTHLLLVFASDDGASGYEVRAAVLDTAAPGAVTSFAVPASAGASADDRRDPNVMRVDDKLFIAWRAEAVPGATEQDDLWLKEISWTSGTVVLTADEVRLPRWPSHIAGDQRRPALASIPIAAGNALIGAWDDLGKTFGLLEGNGDVVVEMIPLPLLRLSDP